MLKDIRPKDIKTIDELFEQNFTIHADKMLELSLPDFGYRTRYVMHGNK
jgi:hypothetical protein